MKRGITSLLLASAFVVTSGIAHASTSLNIVFDGKKVDFPDAQPEVVNGRTMVPISLVASTLGAKVSLSGENYFTIDKGSKHLKITWNSPTAYVNDQPVQLDAPAYIKDNRTYVPLRFVSEAFSGTVGYDGDKQAVIIDSFDPEGKTLVTIDRVVDGDTVEANINGVEEKIRLIGVDTPETVKPNTPVMPYGPEASNFTKATLTGQQVYLDFDAQQRDKYGRLLAYVYLKDGTFFNAKLVREGYARVETIAPDVKHANLFVALLKEARNDHKGFWSLPSDPWNGNTGINDGTPITGTENNTNTGSAASDNTSTQTATTGNVVIDSVDLQGEVVVIHNTDNKDIDLSGWKLVSEEGNQTFNFPKGFVLKAGQTVKVVSGKGATNNPPGQLLWTTSYIWNNNGDTAVLYDGQGNEICRK
jgi:micrococcal nuclease